jgi:hypothetical protein
MATYDDYMTQIAERRQEVGQRIAGLPQFETDLREEVYGKEQAVPSLRENISSQMRQLYDVDKRAADQYSNPNAPLYIRDPYKREQMMGQQHTRGMETIQGLQNMLAGRQDVIGNALDKGLQIYQAGVDAANFERQGLLDELNAAIAVQKARSTGTGGSGTSGSRYSDLVRRLMASPDFNPESYPNLRTDEPFLQYLEANPAADYDALATYLPDLVAYPNTDTNASLQRLQMESNIEQPLQEFAQVLAATPTSVTKEQVWSEAAIRYPQLFRSEYGISQVNELMTQKYGY